MAVDESSMDRICLSIAVLFALSVKLPGASAISPPAVLKSVAERYKTMKIYDIQAERRVGFALAGQSGVNESKVELAVGSDGRFRVEQSGNGITELRVSDGKNTWKSLPRQRTWSKQEVAQVMDEEDEEQSGSDSSMGQDLLTQTQQAFVKRYMGLERYNGVAVIEKEEKLKINGDKVDCVVIRIPLKASDNRLYIAKDTNLVLRHTELVPDRGGQLQITTDYKRIDMAQPPPELFTFEPSRGSKEVSDVSLPSEQNMSLVGRQATDFTLKNLDGLPVHLAELRGKVVMLDFWASWCPPCRRELPTIDALGRKYKDKGVLVLGVNDEDAKIARLYLADHHPDLATLHDDKSKVHRLYGCRAIPTVMVIDRSGVIVAHFVGRRQESELVAALKLAGVE